MSATADPESPAKNIEEIVEHSGTPYFCFKDIDENKPTGSIKIRVETIGYFLKRYREDMVRANHKKLSIDEQLRKFEEYGCKSEKMLPGADALHQRAEGQYLISPDGSADYKGDAWANY